MQMETRRLQKRRRGKLNEVVKKREKRRQERRSISYRKTEGGSELNETAVNERRSWQKEEF